jgi:hypothetical protein
MGQVYTLFPSDSTRDLNTTFFHAIRITGAIVLSLHQRSLTYYKHPRADL